MRTIIVSGPQGCGKTRNANRMRAHFGCREVIDGFAGGPLKPGALHLVQEGGKVRSAGAEHHRYADVARALGLS